MSDKPSCYYTTAPISNEHFNLEHNPARRETMATDNTTAARQTWLNFDANRINEALAFKTVAGEKIIGVHYFKDAVDLHPVKGINPEGAFKSWAVTGEHNINLRTNEPASPDLLMLIEARGGWINIYKGGVVSNLHESFEDAQEQIDPTCYITTIQIEY